MQSDLKPAPRVALFTDTFFEPNGVATLSRQFAEFTRKRSLPLLVMRGGTKTLFTRDGSEETQELKRGPLSFPLDKDLYFDPLLMRHKELVRQRIQEFKPDLIHVTGPGDLGFFGAWAAHVLHIPLVGSWHTNLHEYLAKRLDRALHLLPEGPRRRASIVVQQQSLRGLLRFYRMPRFTLAPNRTLVDLIHNSTKRPSYLMDHGVDLNTYRPARDCASSRPFCIGYVGRLTTEKNVRLFAELEKNLLAAGETNFRFLIVGDGGQQRWLEKRLQRAEFPGVLRGEKLLSAYNQMDAFVFPSRTDTFGLVILEAMATGVPVILAPEAGLRIGITNGVSGFLCDDFVPALRQLMRSRELRETMGRAARNFANTRGWDHVFEHLYETYAEGLSAIRLKAIVKEALV